MKRRERKRRLTFDSERVLATRLFEIDLECELFQRGSSSVGNCLSRRRDVTLRLEEQTEGDGSLSEIFRLDDSFELSDSFREIDDPTSHGEGSATVTTPRGGNGTLCEIREEGAKIVRLLEFAVADSNEVVEVGTNCGNELVG